ncbi:MAG: BLUF domain-containing protein [Paracoccus sp. (in: a-proteobacteria)]|nr:BLUF domain-containing protein [Paracoccus sp. (in: a-proteobacteria)]
MALEFFLYRSSGRFDRFDADCDEIIEIARKRNAELNLTGFLHCEDGMFFQWLEGEAEPLATVRAAIERDPRHSGVKVMMEGLLEAREFPAWSMFRSTRTEGSLLEWVASREISLRDPLVYGQSLLDFMRHICPQSRTA